MTSMDGETALLLGKIWQPARNPYSKEWQALVNSGRPLLMEVGCYEDSVLSREVISRFGENSALRCGLFNGCDLESAAGLKLIKSLVQRHRPIHVWFSCDCSPYCPLQRLNRNTPEQIRALEQKQAKARLQYQGAQEVALFAAHLDSQIHWELAERCGAWKLPLMQEFLRKMQLDRVTCHGCTVGLRSVDKKQLLCKGWTIATRNKAILRHMHLICQRNHAKGECRGRNAVASARYTPAFARKVVDSLCEQEAWPCVLQELNNRETQQQGREINKIGSRDTKQALTCSNCSCEGHVHEQSCHSSEHACAVQSCRSSEHACAVGAVQEEEEEEEEERELYPDEHPNADPGEEIDAAHQGRRKELLKKIQHIHRVTGHGDMDALMLALKARGVSQEVLDAAKAFRCHICAERKKPNPRRHATLEVIPQKWERIQIDAADWEHPVKTHKFRFVLIVDEGSRFKAGRAFSGNPRKAGTWEDMKQVFEQVWLPVHGNPATIRVDPAGPWRSNKADAYFAERGIMLDPIPAEAHWQIGIVERGIRSVKAVMDALAPEFPDMTDDELLGRAIWVCNSRDLYRGFSPVQHASGRTPDAEMRMFETTEERPLHCDLFEDGGFGQNIRAMCTAEKAFSDEQSKQRLQRAQAMGHRKTSNYIPGDLVFYWRRQQAGKSHQSFPKTRFLGPARVLATETRQEPDGSMRPASIVWLHRGGHLLRAAQEQLRHALSREVLIEELKGPIQIPWTMTSFSSDLPGHQC